MELLQLQYFEKIAKYQNMSKAAEELHVSQPALSSCLVRLETELGARLFDRNGKKLVLNSYGRYFLNVTRQILNLVNESRVPIDTRNLKERINVGFMIYNEKLFSIIADFQKENPDVAFNVHGSTMNSAFAYSAYEFIVGLSTESVVGFPNEMTIEPILDYVIVPRNHPLAEKEEISLEELKDEEFCFLRDEEGGYEAEYKACVLSGFVPKCVFVTNNAFFKLRFIAEGTAFGFIPQSWKETYEKCEKIVLIPEKNPLKETAIKMYWSDMAMNSEICRRFLAYVQMRLEKE